MRFNVFLELAVPGILSGIDLNSNMETLEGTYDWVRAGPFNFDNYEKIGLFYHPTKFSQYKASTLGKKFCQSFIQDSLNHLA